MTIRVQSVRLDGHVDPTALVAPGLRRWIGPDHWWVAAAAERDVATLRIDPTDPASVISASTRLATLHDADGAPAPLAVGVRPFAPGQPFDLAVPGAVVRQTHDGETWLTVVGDDDADIDDVVKAWSTPGPASGSVSPSFEVEATMSPEAWCASVTAATDHIRAGELDKVVLARRIQIRARPAHDPARIVAHLRHAFPTCVTFDIDGLIGASPELLVRRSSNRVTALPLAGTAPRLADPTEDARRAASLLASAKDRAEHQITIDMVADRLLPHCSWLDALAEPTVVAMANVQHLGTLVEGRLSDPAATSLQLMCELHPTPAVGGHPTEAALSLLGELEDAPRGRYAGAVGWMDCTGDGEWMVAIRCAELDPADASMATVWSGVGVVADSDPLAELAETRQKLRAILGALIRP